MINKTSALSSFSKLLSLVMVPSIFFGSLIFSFFGFSLSSEKDPELLKMYEQCQPHERLSNGRCPKPLRNSYGRSFRGGSYGFGK